MAKERLQKVMSYCGVASRRACEKIILEGRVSVNGQPVTVLGSRVDPEHQKMIFEKFRQIDASATREHHGTGLGLAIAKELASLLGGTIGLHSRPGAGATFWVQLPAEAPDTSDRPLVSLT